MANFVGNYVRKQELSNPASQSLNWLTIIKIIWNYFCGQIISLSVHRNNKYNLMVYVQRHAQECLWQLYW